MPVYNTPVSYLKEAIESILNQTYRDFEFIIIDDGSTGECTAYLDNLNDERVRLIRNPENLGITKSLNIGFQAARGKYIARMDSDDISLQNRFEKQLAFMESHPDAIVCGTKTVNLGNRLIPIKYKKMESMEHYRVRLLFIFPGPRHPTAFFDHEKLLEHQITYDESLPYSQDYDMWMKVSQIGTIYIMPEVLLLYRIHPKQITKVHRERQICCQNITTKKLLIQLLDNVTDEEVAQHQRWSEQFSNNEVITPQVAIWYDRLIAANMQKKIYNERLLKNYINLIKGKLVYQTFKKDMTIFEKIRLVFHYHVILSIQNEIYRRLKEHLSILINRKKTLS